MSRVFLSRLFGPFADESVGRMAEKDFRGLHNGF